MFTRERVPMTYSRAELLSDAAVHVTGVVAAFIAVPVLVTLAAVWFGDATTVIAAAVYGLSLIAMLLCSAANNMIQMPARKDLLRRIVEDEIDPSFVVTHSANLEDGPDLYKTFRDKEDGCIKVVLKP